MTTTKKTTANKGFASGGLKCKIQQQFFNLTLVIKPAFVLRFPARTQSPETLCDIPKPHFAQKKNFVNLPNGILERDK